MHTLRLLQQGIRDMPASAAWYLAAIAEAKGKQDLYTQQSPQTLRVLREHALIESAVSSNRIEGVEIDRRRVATVVFGCPLLRDRNEEEVQGYRNALEWIHGSSAEIPFSEATIRKVHAMARGDVWDAGMYKEKDGDIIERLPNGDTRVRFRTVSAEQTPGAVAATRTLTAELLRDAAVHPLVVVAACNLDLLCIHPFRDGNGRVSRLLLLLQLYRAGYEVGRYISLERLIEEHKERYYETLEASSRGWHEGRHDPWAYIGFVLYILKTAYDEFVSRVGTAHTPRGGKTELVQHATEGFRGEFTLSALCAACPGVSRDMVRKVLRGLRNEGVVVCTGRGPAARWKRKGSTSRRGY